MDEVAGAIADPVRREILEILRAEARLSAGEIAERFAISRPAVSRHLRVLRESGLVHDELVGRQRFYVLDASRLTPLAQWLAEFDAPTTAAADRPSAWEHRLDALETEVYRTRRDRRTTHPTTARTAADGLADRPAASITAADGPAADRSAGRPAADGTVVDRFAADSPASDLPASDLRATRTRADGSTLKENTA